MFNKAGLNENINKLFQSSHKTLNDENIIEKNRRDEFELSSVPGLSLPSSELPTLQNEGNKNSTLESNQPSTTETHASSTSNRFRVVKRRAPEPFTRGRWIINDRLLKKSIETDPLELTDISEGNIAKNEDNENSPKDQDNEKNSLSLNLDIANELVLTKKVVQALDLVKTHVISTLSSQEKTLLSSLQYLKQENKELKQKLEQKESKIEELLARLDQISERSGSG
ncbi:MAG: hypothetical protein MHPSP_001922 [Paramarteilia canceri]